MKKLILSIALIVCVGTVVAKRKYKINLPKHQFHRSGRHLYTRFSQDEEKKVKKFDKQKLERISLPVLELDYTYNLTSLKKVTAEGLVVCPIREDVFLGAGASVKLPLKKYDNVIVPVPHIPNFVGDFVVGKRIDASSLIRMGISYDPKDKERNSMGYLNYEIRY